MSAFFVRVGVLAEVFPAKYETPLDHGRRVLVRTGRGVELGIVVGARQDDRANPLRVIRPTTAEDEMLIQRLARHKRQAVEACRSELAQSGSQAVLMDVDQLFDGGTLVMHFLGPVDEIAESVTRAIAARYESVVQTSRFAALLQDGCGPDCGTEAAGGCGTSCGACSIKCHSRK